MAERRLYVPVGGDAASPESLKGRFIIRDKYTPSEDHEVEEEDETDEEEESDESKKASRKPKAKRTRSRDLQGMVTKTRSELLSTNLTGQTHVDATRTAKDKSPTLDKLIFIKNTKTRTLDDAQPGQLVGTEQQIGSSSWSFSASSSVLRTRGGIIESGPRLARRDSAHIWEHAECFCNVSDV